MMARKREVPTNATAVDGLFAIADSIDRFADMIGELIAKIEEDENVMENRSSTARLAPDTRRGARPR